VCDVERKIFFIGCYAPKESRHIEVIGDVTHMEEQLARRWVALRPAWSKSRNTPPHCTCHHALRRRQPTQSDTLWELLWRRSQLNQADAIANKDGDNPNCLWMRESGRYEQNGCVGSMRSEAMADYSSWGSWGATSVAHTSVEHKNRRARYCPLGACVCRAAKSAHW
jgi:hypothetical protein